MKKVAIGLLILAVAILSVLYFKKDKTRVKSDTTQNMEQQTRSQQETAKTEMESVTMPAKTYTMEEVAAHGADPDSEECWAIIHGRVYDILEFASNSHPGGELIFQACGIDATKLFETRPMGSKIPHSENARKMLEQYYIGDLKK